MEKLRRFICFVNAYISYLGTKKEKIQSVGSEVEKQAKKRPDKALILFEDRTVTYKEFNEMANRYADLFSSMGMNRGDAVALFMENRPEFLMVHAGLSKVGIVPALLNYNIRGNVLAHAINIAEPAAVIVGHELADEFLKVRTKVKLKKPARVFIEKEGKVLKTPKGMEDLNPLLAACSIQNPVVNPPISSRDVLEYIYTSGTTGLPKATVLRHQRWLQLGYGSGGLFFSALPGDIQYFCLPLYHNSGINIAWASTVMYGGTFAMRRKFSASAFWDDIRKYNANIFVYIGELCRYLNNQPRKENDADNPLRVMVGNGMRADYWTEFQERFGIERIVEVYGATEGVGALANRKGVPGMIGSLSILGIRMGEVARYNPETGEFIRNGKGFVEKCKPGEKGIFLAAINDKNPFSGYKNNQKSTSEKIIENVFRKGDKYFISGDLFELHEKEYVSFVDRLGDTFKWKGEVVSTNEVADVINRFGHIEDSNVYGVEVKKTEGRCGMVALTLLAKETIDWKAFANYIVENLPVYARPYFVRIRKEIDATSSFKQLKTDLQKDGFDPSKIKDKMYFLNPDTCKYIPLTKKVYDDVQSGKYRF